MRSFGNESRNLLSSNARSSIVVTMRGLPEGISATINFTWGSFNFSSRYPTQLIVSRSNGTWADPESFSVGISDNAWSDKHVSIEFYYLN